jgi:hypothetical protein
MTHTVRPLLFFSLCAALLAGCSSEPETAKVSGKVTYKGQPVTGGQMYFYPAEGGGLPGSITPDGTYAIVGLPPGKVTVTIETESINPNRTVRTYGDKRGGGMGPTPEGVNTSGGGIYVQIPKKYAQKATTDLTFEVTGGEQTHDIQLKD